jgi:hypothetical protein
MAPSPDCSPARGAIVQPNAIPQRRLRVIVPQLKNQNIRIRLAKNAAETQAANRLVCTNYIEEGYWDSDEPFQKNVHMHSLVRTVFVAEDKGHIFATASIIKDSRLRLPADKFQPEAIGRWRVPGSRLAEVSALAVDKRCEEGSALVLFLFKYVYQYSFYYASIDRFVVVPTMKHVSFYRRVCGFQELSNGGKYDYVKPSVRAQLLAADLFGLHRYFFDRYEAGSPNQDNFYRFLLVNDHPNLQFPDKRLLRRPREIDWLAQARLRQMPLAG